MAVLQLRSFQCGVLKDGKKSLLVDPSTLCSDQSRMGFMISSSALACLCLYVPADWLRNLQKHVTLLNPNIADVEQMLKARDKEPRLASSRFLWQDYSAKFWFWDVVDVLRRTILIGVLPLFPTGVLRTSAGLLISFVSLILYREACPYRKRENNLLAIAAQFQTFAAFVGATVRV